MALYDLLPTRRSSDIGRMRGNWNPMTAFQREINRVFNDFSKDFDIAPFREMEEQMGRFAPCINLSETSKEIKVNAELPGMEEKDISVSVEDDTLILRGERKEEKKEEDEEQYHREISYGTFQRMIPLSAKIDIDKVEANFKKGVLKITLPKVAGLDGEKTKKIEINSK